MSQFDLNSLRLKLYAEFDNWQDFVWAVDEFQKKTSIKLTITTSRKMKPLENTSRRIRVHQSIKCEDASSDNKKCFEYKYMKLTCKHYGGYKSTSRGIRPNQRTAKLMCPTYIYGCFDHFKQKFIIKQMVVDCNHELRDEEVLVTKVLKDPSDSRNQSNNGDQPPKKKYIKIRNRNVLKVPLESPNVSNYLPATPVKIRCNHEMNESCEATSLTTEDLHSIHELFNCKPKKEQNKLMIEWIQVLPFDTSENTVQVLFSLPAFDGSLIKVCYKAFSQVLRVSVNRIYDLIYEHYDENGNLNEANSSRGNGDSREIEKCIANILTSFSKEQEQEQEQDTEDCHQVIYCDTVDVPYDTIEDALVEENLSNILESQSDKSEPQLDSQECVVWNNLKPPLIKLSPVDRGFVLEVDCDFNINLKAVNIENDRKTLKVCFNSKQENEAPL